MLRFLRSHCVVRCTHCVYLPWSDCTLVGAHAGRANPIPYPHPNPHPHPTQVGTPGGAAASDTSLLLETLEEAVEMVRR